LAGALHDDGTTETTTEEDDLGFPSGVYTATHQFQQDSKYRIVFLLHNEKENEIAKTDITLEITGVELAIIVPEQPLKTGYEYTFTAQNDYPEKMPEDPVYEWDFGDNNGKIIPFSNEATHLYEKEGTYTIRVLLFESDEEAAPLLEVATAEVKVEAGTADFLSYIQQTTHLLVGVRGDTTYYQSDGYTRSQEGATLSAYLSLSSTSWEGTHFSNRYFSPPTDSSSGMSITIEGDVSQEGDKVFNLSAMCIYDDAHRLAGEERETRISLVNVKLEPKSPIPSTYDPNYKPQFVAYIEGPEVANYVTSTFYEHRQPQTSDPNFKTWYDPLRFTDTKYTPYLLIVFKTERIDAHDDPGYQQRD